MTERRTNEELADALNSMANLIVIDPDVYFNFDEDDCREAAQRLRDMPEGERIEGWAFDSGDPEGVWYFYKNRPSSDDGPATLTIHERKEGESNERM